MADAAPSDVSHITSDAEESNFSSVVRLGTSNQYLLLCALVDDALVAKDCCWLTHLTGVMRPCRRLQMAVGARLPTFDQTDAADYSCRVPSDLRDTGLQLGLYVLVCL